MGGRAIYLSRIAILHEQCFNLGVGKIDLQFSGFQIIEHLARDSENLVGWRMTNAIHQDAAQIGSKELALGCRASSWLHYYLFEDTSIIELIVVQALLEVLSSDSFVIARDVNGPDDLQDLRYLFTRGWR